MNSGRPEPLARIVPLMVVMVAIPAALTLRTVLAPATLEVASPDPTPHGYTWSLLLFVFPLAVLHWWFLSHPRFTFERTAYWLTVGLLAPTGFILASCSVTRFSRFPTPARRWV